MIPSQELESQYHSYELNDDEENHADVDNGVNVGDVNRAENGVAEHGPTSVDEHGLASEEGGKRDKGRQEAEDITAETCVDPTKFWNTLQVPNIPPEECASGSNIEAGSDELRSLEGSDSEEVEQGLVRKFINRRYHEFNPKRDMQDPVFKVIMVFGSANMFRKAIRARAVKHKSEKYVGQWKANLEWNYAGMSMQLRVDTKMDASRWQFYRARKVFTWLDRFNQWMERMVSENQVAYDCNTSNSRQAIDNYDGDDHKLFDEKASEEKG
ncbi:hypothetical protein Q3G72_008038 [Acer saccharum]|nr:hypothetical protein Q3G72_008038 [Acer saccharum]